MTRGLIASLRSAFFGRFASRSGERRYRDHLNAQISAWFGVWVAFHLAVGIAQLFYEISLNEQQVQPWVKHVGMVKVILAGNNSVSITSTLNEVHLSLGHYWDHSCRAFGHLKVAILFFAGVFLSLLKFKRLTQSPVCVPVLCLLFRVSLIDLSLGLVSEDKPSSSHNPGALFHAIDGFMLVLLPSLNLPLIWPSQLVLRLFLEFFQSLYFYRIMQMDIGVIVALFSARSIVALSLGFIAEFRRRRSFLHSDPYADKKSESGFPIESNSTPQLLSNTSSIHSYPLLGTTSVIIKTSHIDDVAPPIIDEAYLKTRFYSECFPFSSMDLLSASVRRGCFIFELNLIRSGVDL